MLKLLINNLLFKLLIALISTASAIGVFYVVLIKLTGTAAPEPAVTSAEPRASVVGPASSQVPPVPTSTVLFAISAGVTNDETTAEVSYKVEPCTPTGGFSGRIYKAQGPATELSLQMSEFLCLEVREGSVSPLDGPTLSWSALDASEELAIYTESSGVSFIDRRGEPKVLLVGSVGSCVEGEVEILCSGFINARVGGPQTSLTGSLAAAANSVVVSSARTP